MRHGIYWSLTPMLAAAGCLSGGLLPSVAHAGETGFYFGGDIGNSTEHFDADTFGVNANDTAYKVAAGFRPLSVLAGELDYISFGRASGGTNYADTDGVAISALAFLPIPLVDVYGRVGLMNYHVAAHSPQFGFHRDGSDLTYGVGLGAHWGGLGARLEYQRFQISGASTMEMATAGINWTFGWPL